MNNSNQETSPRKPEVNWSKELGSELERGSYCNVIPKDPSMVEEYVTAAVYKTLSGEEVALKERQRFVRDSSTIKDEVNELGVSRLMEQARHLVSGSKGYEQEQIEAVSQGKKAKEDIDRHGRFDVRYDYWMGIVPIKAGVSLRTMDGFPQHLLLNTSLSEIGGNAGFPDNILSREVGQKSQSKDAGSILRFAEEIARKFGINPPDFIQSMFDDREIIFVMAMNNCGHTNFDQVRRAIVDSGREGHKLYSPEEKFEMLSEKEKKAVQEPLGERLHGEITRELVSGKSKGIFSVNIWTSGDVWYDPKKKKIDGKFTPSASDVIYVSLIPIITPDTTHQELLDIRKKGQILAKELGFPERQNLEW